MSYLTLLISHLISHFVNYSYPLTSLAVFMFWLIPTVLPHISKGPSTIRVEAKMFLLMVLLLITQFKSI